MDEAHEEIADLRAVQRLVKQTILSMKNHAFQGSFDQIIVEWRRGFSQEQGQPPPVPQQVGDRFAQAGVWLRFPFRQLRLQPNVQCLHDRAAVLSVSYTHLTLPTK